METIIVIASAFALLLLAMGGAAWLLGYRWAIPVGACLGVVAELTLSAIPGQVTCGHFEPWIQEASAAFLSAGFIALILLAAKAVEEIKVERRIRQNLAAWRAEAERAERMEAFRAGFIAGVDAGMEAGLDLAGVEVSEEA